MYTMGSPSVSTHRGLVHWQGLLLVVSLLNFWSQPITAQVTVVSINALEGTDVTLHIRHNVRYAEYFRWFKGTTIDRYHNIAYFLAKTRSLIRGPRGRQVIVNNDGSLFLRNITMEDSGIYTVVVYLRGCQKMTACGVLAVYPRVSGPTLLASNTTVTENKDAVVMTCDTNQEAIEWFFNNKSLILTERTTLSLDLKNLTIDPVLRWDAGDYQCKAYNPKTSGKSSPLKLDVIYK